MKNRILVYLGVFCLVALTLGGCVGGQTDPVGFSGVTPHDGLLYLGSTDGKVMAVNPSARNEEIPFPSSSDEWSFLITKSSKSIACGSSSVPVAIYSTPTIAGGLVCVGTYNGKVLMLSPAARSQGADFPQMRSGEWVYPRAEEDVIGSIVGSPVATEDTVYVCSSDSRVYALDMVYGDERWKSDPLDDKLWVTPVVKDGVVYVSTFEGHIYTLSADNGALLPWSFEADIGFVSSPVLYDGTILVGSFDSKLYAIRVGSDVPLWAFPADKWFWAAPVVDEGIVYAGCLDGKVYAIELKTGEEVWEFDTGSPVVSSPALVSDVLVVACDSGDVYALDAAGGGLINKVSMDVSIRGILCVLDGIVYLRAQDNCLYAMDVAKGKIDWQFPVTIK